jgi:hypothetical protein
MEIHTNPKMATGPSGMIAGREANSSCTPESRDIRTVLLFSQICKRETEFFAYVEHFEHILNLKI